MSASSGRERMRVFGYVHTYMAQPESSSGTYTSTPGARISLRQLLLLVRHEHEDTRLPAGRGVQLEGDYGLMAHL